MTTDRLVYGSYRFYVEIDTISEGTFSECTGLQAETEIFEWEEGGLNEYKHRLPGRTKYTNLVLKRGVATAKLWEWYAGVISGDIKRYNLSVVLNGYGDSPAIRWNVNEAVPVKWVGPTFKSGSTEAAVETLELAHHGFKRV